MKLAAISVLRQRYVWWVVVAIYFGAGLLAFAPYAEANESEALRILKSMSDFLGSQKAFSAEFDVDIEIITPEIQKIQFNSTGKFTISHPDKLRAERLGGYSHAEMVFDGTTLTLVDRDRNVYGQIESPGTVDDLIHRLTEEFGLEMPGGDLLLTNAYDVLSSRILDAKHIGAGIVDGIECEHLAFRNADTDWQIWIEAGDRPVPCKYVITSKTLAAAPQYTLRVHSWNFDPVADADAFKFTPQAEARKVALEELSNIDELPPPAAPGDVQ
jgi:hypothetical protein